MNHIKLIWAETENGYIGKDGDLAYRDSDDLKRFRELTMGSNVVMGRKTAESLPKPLPHRCNIVLSGNKSLDIHPDFVIIDSVEEILKAYQSFWAIGGKAILEAFMPLASDIHQTVFTGITVEGDVNAPEIHEQEFTLYNSMRINQHLTFNHYVRNTL